MAEGKKSANNWLIILIIIIGVLAVLWAANKARLAPPPALNPIPFSQIHTEMPDISSPSSIITEDMTAEDNNPIRIKDIINSKKRRGWDTVYKQWYGRPAPDFTLTDINGKKHTLSDYHGKDVIIVFWATWCVPCIQEIPHLIALRNIISENDLAILAISNESPALLRQFIAGSRINYTIISSLRASMPSPFRSITGIPTSFFVDKKGRIKIATQGVLHLGDTKIILKAK